MPWMVSQPNTAASASRTPSRCATLVASSRYTEPISTMTPVSTDRMPRICGSQAMPARMAEIVTAQLSSSSAIAVSSATDGASSGLGVLTAGRVAS